MAEIAEYGLATPADYDEIVEFANFVFSYSHRPHEFKTLIPKVYGQARCQEAAHFVAREGGKIRALVGLATFNQRVLGETLKFGFIGTVSVHPYSRGRGHMKRLMPMAEEYARKTGHDLIALGGQRQRYEYFGYEPGGTVYSFRVGASNCRHALAGEDAAGIRFEPFERVRARIPELHAIYESGSVAGARPPEHFEQICGTWYNQPFAILDGDEAVGYLIASEGGARVEELRLKAPERLGAVLKAYIAEKAPNGVNLRVSPQHPEILRPIAQVCENFTVGQNECFLLLNFERVARAYLQLKQRADGPLPDGHVVLGIEGEPSLSIRVSGGEIECRQAGEAPGAVFTRLQAQNLMLSPLPFVDLGALPACARRYFPLPISIERADGF